jgi:hypothetical protein
LMVAFTNELQLIQHLSQREIAAGGVSGSLHSLDVFFREVAFSGGRFSLIRKTDAGPLASLVTSKPKTCGSTSPRPVPSCG